MLNDRLMQTISLSVRETISVFQSILADMDLMNTLETATNKIVDACKRGNKVLICGNGGSAADAQHIAAELSGKFFFDRKPLFAEALHVNTSYMTAVANDYSYADVFARLIEGQGKPSDILIALSTSGSSENIIRAVSEARRQKMITVAFTGQKPNRLEPLCDYIIAVPSRITPRIQEAHIALGHIICELVENSLFATEKPAIFLDRDGVINRKMPEGDYVKELSEFSILPDVPKAIKMFNDGGYIVIVVTNQQCVGKGIVSRDTVDSIHNHMKRQIERQGGFIEAVYVCPHTVADNCSCRKPAPGLIETAIRDLSRKGTAIDRAKSYMIGDSDKDILAGKNAGLHTVFITDNGTNPAAIPSAAGLLEAAHHVMNYKIQQGP